MMREPAGCNNPLPQVIRLGKPVSGRDLLTEMASNIRKIQPETGDDILISHIMDVIDTGEHLFIFHLQRCSLSRCRNTEITVP
jgi:hypothetical protein